MEAELAREDPAVSGTVNESTLLHSLHYNCPAAPWSPWSSMPAPHSWAGTVRSSLWACSKLTVSLVFPKCPTKLSVPSSGLQGTGDASSCLTPWGESDAVSVSSLFMKAPSTVPGGYRGLWPDECSEWILDFIHKSIAVIKPASCKTVQVTLKFQADQRVYMSQKARNNTRYFSWLEFVYLLWYRRRDYETKPPKLQLLSQIRSHLHRSDPHWTPEPDAPLDYCYVRPNHIPTINSMCQEFFWPGMFPLPNQAGHFSVRSILAIFKISLCDILKIFIYDFV